MRVIINKDYDEVCQWVASYIKLKILEKENITNEPFILGLPTGSTPIGIYKKLIEYYKNDEISFKNVITFNMDEYVGLGRDHDQSYKYFMYNNFFNHIDIPEENINLLDGLAKDLDNECIKYEKKIEKYGMIDLFLCGV